MTRKAIERRKQRRHAERTALLRAAKALEDAAAAFGKFADRTRGAVLKADAHAEQTLAAGEAARARKVAAGEPVEMPR